MLLIPVNYEKQELRSDKNSTKCSLTPAENMHFFANRHQDIFHLIELLNRMERIHAYFEAGKLIIE